MYAAAGGASLASRQKRKNQAAQAKKDTAKNQQLLREKLAQVKAAGASTPTKSRGFHQLPAGYLRPPQGQGRKLSATYTGTQGSRLLLTINEGLNDEPRSPHHGSHLLSVGPNNASSSLHRSATASIPLMQQAHSTDASSPPVTPNVCFPDNKQQFEYDGPNLGRYKHRLTLPLNDSIYVTPASPYSLTPTQLERKCSVYRGKKLDPYDEQFYRTTNIRTAQEIYNEEFRTFVPIAAVLPNGGHRWDSEGAWYCIDPEHQKTGICTCDPEVQDVSIAGSSDDEDILGVIRGPSTFANAFLYIGFGTIALGLVTVFIGNGEKGFKTVELRLVGPVMIIVGFVFMVIRIFFCICPSSCIKRKEDKNKKDSKADAQQYLLRNNTTKRVSIARTPMGPNNSSHSKLSRQNTKSIVKTKTYEGVEAFRQIATTSLHLQNEDYSKQPTSSSLVVPTINEPEDVKEEASIELKRISSIDVDTLNIIDITSPNDDYLPDVYTDDDDDDDEEGEVDDDGPNDDEDDDQTSDDDDDSRKLIADDADRRSLTSSLHRQDSHRSYRKLTKQRVAANQTIEAIKHHQQQHLTTTTITTMSSSTIPSCSSNTMETSLMVIQPPVSTPPPLVLHHHQHHTTQYHSPPSLPFTTAVTTTITTTSPTSHFKFNLLSPPPSRTSTTTPEHFRFDTPLTNLTHPLINASTTTASSSSHLHSSPILATTSLHHLPQSQQPQQQHHHHQPLYPSPLTLTSAQQLQTQPHQQSLSSTKTKLAAVVAAVTATTSSSSSSSVAFPGPSIHHPAKSSRKGSSSSTSNNSNCSNCTTINIATTSIPATTTANVTFASTSFTLPAATSPFPFSSSSNITPSTAASSPSTTTIPSTSKSMPRQQHKRSSDSELVLSPSKLGQ